MNTVQYLKGIQFSSLSNEEKLQIKTNGRPMPIFIAEKSELKIKESRTFMRRIHTSDIYKKNDWICGCELTKAFYCFPCLLFGDRMRPNTAWINTGIDDIKHLFEKIRKHEVNIDHMNCVLELQNLFANHMELSKQYKDNKYLHNQKVSENRLILKKLINCMKFYSSLQMNFQQTGQESINIYDKLIDFAVDLDYALKHHIAMNPSFRASINSIQNEILISMYEVSREEIIDQVSNTKFISFDCDQIFDVSDHTAKLVLIIRYIHDGSLCEHFWSFLNPRVWTANSIADCIVEQLDPLIGRTPGKLISQSYDGGNIMCKVQELVRNQYPDAIPVHSYAHTLDLILKRTVSFIKRVRIFFAHITYINDYFTNTIYKNSKFIDIMNKRLPKLMYDNFINIHLLYDCRDKFVRSLEEIQMRCHNDLTVHTAGNLIRLLKDQEFLYWLNIFNKIYQQVNIIYSRTHGNRENISTLLEKFSKQIDEELGEYIGENSNSFDETTMKSEQPSDEDEEEEEEDDDDELEDEQEVERSTIQGASRVKAEVIEPPAMTIAGNHEETTITSVEEHPLHIKLEQPEFVVVKSEEAQLEEEHEDGGRLGMEQQSAEPPRKKRRRCNNKRPEKSAILAIKKQMKYRFQSVAHLSASLLVKFDFFHIYSDVMPDIVLNEVIKEYKQLNKEKLKSELFLLYKRSEFKSLNTLTNLLFFIEHKNYKQIFSELLKLLHIIITIPMPTNEKDRCFTTLQNVCKFLQNTKTPATFNYLNSLAMCTINHSLIKEIAEFDEKIVKKFANKHMDFKYI